MEPKMISLPKPIPGDVQMRLVERHHELGGEPRALRAVPSSAASDGLGGRVGVLHGGREGEEHQVGQGRRGARHFPEFTPE